MVKEHSIILTVLNMKESGNKISKMDMEFLLLKMEQTTQDPLKKTECLIELFRALLLQDSKI